MRRSSCVGVILLLGLGILPASLSAQQPGGTSGNRGAPDSRVGPNYPNPFNPQTWVPFKVLDEDVRGGPVRVTIRIFNVLQQLVAYPVVQGYPEGGEPVANNLEFREPGTFTAYWDGKDSRGKQVASGLYYIQVVYNGRTVGIKKALVAK